MLNQDLSKAPISHLRKALAALLALASVALLMMPGAAQAAGPLSVDVTANPSTLKAPGGTVTFTVVVTNNGNDPLQITSLTDSEYGDLNGKGTCGVGAVLAANGGTYQCQYQADITGVGGASQANTVTAIAGGQSDSDTAVVVITPRLGISTTAVPSSIPPPGGTVTFSVAVVNLGSDSITISALTDSVYGDLSTKGTCTTAVGTVLASEGSNYSCSFTANVSQTQTNTATVSATGTGGPFSASDPATVTIAPAATQATTTTKVPTTSLSTTTTNPASTVGLTISLSQSSGVPGERLTVSGTGWAANELLTVTFNSLPKTIGTVIADSGGRFSVNVKVPEDAAVGGHTIVVTGQAGRSVSRPFTVNAGLATDTTVAGGSVVTPTTLRSGGLVRTGMSSDLALFAAIALMLGAAAVLGAPKGRLAWSTRQRASNT